MVINNLQKVSLLSSLAFAISLGALAPAAPAFAESNVDFQVNVHEVLSVSVTTSESVVTGDINQFLRNKVSLSVSSNNGNGFRASMTTSTAETSLSKSGSSGKIPTLSSNSTRGNFPSNSWGYSLSDYFDNGATIGDNDEGSDNSIYKPIAASTGTPITVLSSDNVSSGSQNIYFGAKADSSVDAGTYSNIVVISVVSGAIDSENPAIPSAPAKDSDTSSSNPAYNSTHDRTVQSTTTTDNQTETKTVTTQVSNGDTRTSYANPYGVSDSKPASENTAIASGLAATAVVATIAGAALLAAGAKRQKDDD